MEEYVKSDSKYTAYSVGQRLDKLEKTVEILSNSFDSFKTNSLITDTRVSERLDQLLRDGEDAKNLQKETSRKIDDLIEQQHRNKSDKWDTVIKTIITALVSGLVVYALTQIGLK